ncbi:MAG: hypothetical protein LAKADJCE_00627 [Candidatus Argoarchaeum ethanivorans]|uniref:UPF0179 protein LAKADJCE_00627 n=1 Tax=Candidatus Argoarchaeum ethanivorans TaxID=2608793 RepID=A0A811T9H1_9EURY|nr:MAG: hypothetical protein LAKADJCE_00627 [Candidatus Argoarchaeum ethanivorans]
MLLYYSSLVSRFGVFDENIYIRSVSIICYKVKLRMVDLNSIITLIGTRLAIVGNEFIFYGPAAECEGCKLKNTCNNLKVGNKYRIASVKKEQVHKCAIHDIGVYAVEVVPGQTVALVDSKKAFNGSKIVYEPPDCSEFDCADYDRCHPVGLNVGDKYTIVELLNEERPQCQMGYSLKAVALK